MRCSLLLFHWHHPPDCGVLARLLIAWVVVVWASLRTLRDKVEACSAPDQDNEHCTKANDHPLARHRWAVPLAPRHWRVVNCVLAPHLGNDLHRAVFALPACSPVVLSCGKGGNSELDIARAVAAFPLNVAVVVAVAVGKEDEGDVLQRGPERTLATEGSERHAPGERCPAFAREQRIGRGGDDTEQAPSKPCSAGTEGRGQNHSRIRAGSFIQDTADVALLGRAVSDFE
jgi:hypothetical protein